MHLLERRIGLLFAAFLTLLLIAGGRTLWLAGVEGGSLASAAASQQVTSAPLRALRGAIVDRRGVELAVSEPADDISATPYLVKDAVKTAQRLAPILGVPVEKLVQKLARRDTGFVYLARQLPADQAAEVSRLRLPGIDLTPSHRRTYPNDVLASQLLGSVGLEGDGLAGLEYSSDKLLAGADGERRLVKDALGKPIKVRDTRPALPGARLQLTIDAALQRKVEEVLGQVGEKFRPKGGATAVVMDPDTGEVLALANWPLVNANSPATASPEWARKERAVGLTYEPGSTFKSFTVAGALEDEVVTPTTRFFLPQKIQVADREIGEAHQRGDITLNTSEILAQSSNVGAIKIGVELGKRNFDKWVRRFGFGTPTGIELAGEERGIVLELAEYSDSSIGNMPMGQGMAVTPLQMARAYSAIANGGILRKPHIIKQIDGKATATQGNRVISEHTSEQLRVMLKGAFAPGGTASEVSIPNYDLAGKTGTANKIDAETGEYSDSQYIASFFGFVPALEPELVIGVVVDEPQGDIYGGQVAAPAFGDIASFALQYLRIPPQ